MATRNRWAWGSTGYRIYPYVNWAPSQPAIAESETSEAQCIVLDPEQSFQWVSEPCGYVDETNHYFFCELYNDKVNLNFYDCTIYIDKIRCDV